MALSRRQHQSEGTKGLDRNRERSLRPSDGSVQGVALDRLAAGFRDQSHQFTAT